jgi:hypothetical protein
MDSATAVRDLLFTLLLKVGVASSIAALLARWNTFRRVLFTEERDPDQKLKLMLFMTPPLILGVTLRLVGYPYQFADLSLEGDFLMGMLGSRVGLSICRRWCRSPAGTSCASCAMARVTAASKG